MSPITEDQVVALLDGLAEREKDAIARRAKAIDDGETTATSTGLGAMTARIIRLKTKSDDTVTRLRGGEVIALDAARAQRRRAVSGFFFYTRSDNAPA